MVSTGRETKGRVRDCKDQQAAVVQGFPPLQNIQRFTTQGKKAEQLDLLSQALYRPRNCFEFMLKNNASRGSRDERATLIFLSECVFFLWRVNNYIRGIFSCV